MFEQTLISLPVGQRGGRRLALLPLALVIHVALLALVAAVQLWAVDEIPPPREDGVIWVGAGQAPSPLPPPPARRPPGAAQPARATASVQPSGVPETVSPPPAAPEPPGGGSGVDGGLDPDGGGDEWQPERSAEVTPVLGPAPSDREPVFVLGGDVLPPIPLARTPPVYPEPARIARREGAVKVELVLDVAGRVVEARLIEDRVGFGCGAAALAAIRHWRYEPATRRRVPVSVRLVVTVTFTLRAP
ncbi:MAG: energy transducer TonB [Acidobacteriota bacterium]